MPGRESQGGVVINVPAPDLGPEPGTGLVDMSKVAGIQRSERSAPRSKLPLIAAVLLLSVIGIAAAVVLGTSKPSAEVLLKRAEEAESPEAKGKALLEVAGAPDVADAQLQRAAELLETSQQWAVADQVADAWLLRSPKNVEAHLLKARSSMHLRKGKRAETEAAEATAIAPDDIRGLVVLAELRELQGDAPGALEAWTKAAKKKPNDAHVLSRQGYWLSQAGRLDEAAEVLGHVLKRQFSAEAAAELGFVKFRKEQPDEALKLLARAVKEKPDLMVAHYYRAAVLYQKGDAKQARAEYLEADKLAQDDSRPLIALCELEVQQQTTSELDEVKKRIRTRFPADADKLIAACAP